MASNQLSDADRSSIIVSVDQLFGRVLKHLPCPLQTMDERRDLHWCTLNESQLDGLKLLHSVREQIFYSRGSVTLCIDRLPLRMIRADSLDQAGSFWGAPGDDERPIPRDWIVSRIPNHHRLMEWLELATDLSNQIVVADATCDELLKMCTTPGQIRRVLPELVDFMPIPVKQILNKQARASSTPFEWSAFDRSRVEQLTDTMAKCMLMTADADFRWSGRNNHTWPIVASLHKASDA